jgi:hypothetical protein
MRHADRLRFAAPTGRAHAHRSVTYFLAHHPAFR